MSDHRMRPGIQTRIASLVPRIDTIQACISAAGFNIESRDHALGSFFIKQSANGQDFASGWVGPQPQRGQVGFISRRPQIMG